jgi:hypothetical protein
VSKEQVLERFAELGLDPEQFLVVVRGDVHQGLDEHACGATPVNMMPAGRVLAGFEPCMDCEWGDFGVTTGTGGRPAWGLVATASRLTNVRTSHQQVLTGVPSSLERVTGVLEELAYLRQWKDVRDAVLGEGCEEQVIERLSGDLLTWVGAQALVEEASELERSAASFAALGHGEAVVVALTAVAAVLRAEGSLQTRVLVDLRKAEPDDWDWLPARLLKDLKKRQGALAVVPSGVLRWFLREGDFERCEVLALDGGGSEVTEAHLEAVRVLHEPYGEGKCSTLAGALEVAQAL